MSNELSTPIILLCPNDKSRTYATSFKGNLKDTNLSYFINVDSVPADGSSLLCGDRNLTNKASAGSRFVCLSGTPVIGWTRAIHREQRQPMLRGWKRGQFHQWRCWLSPTYP